ncbi:MAG TPA: DUF1003 domain-containing protein [Chloroflexota bacterium]|jgi:uncharacterized membrane protein
MTEQAAEPAGGNSRTAADQRMLEATRHLEARLVAAVHAKRATRDVNKLHDDSLTLGQRIADGVAATMGSWPFIIAQSVFLTAWIVVNVTEVIFRAWDPYPFILLNLMLSFQAAYAAPIIMMSQNRQAAKDRLQAELDLHTDLRAETLIEELHGFMEQLRLDQWQQLLELQHHQIHLLEDILKRQDGGAPEPAAPPPP